MSALPGDEEAASGGAPFDEQLTPRVDRLRDLRSAWGVLAPAGLVEDATEIGETGRALTDQLSAIVRSHSDVSPAALEGIDELLDAFEASIHQVATRVPVARLRAALPAFRHDDRRGLCDLLDLLIAGGSRETPGGAEQVGAIDYLITLLCTHGAEVGSVRFDPVTLTERLTALCAERDDPDEPRLAEVEAEFFAAATLDEEDLREELQQRTLRRRKVEIGPLYFAPRVLRAIVTYNAALVARVETELLDSADWGDIESPGDAATTAGTGVFDAPPLRALAAAVRRRLQDDPPQPTTIDRVAWALDLAYLADNERKALANESVATADDPLGTAVLVGLLCRSVAVLSIDLQDAGLPPDRITGPWVDELGAVFQQEINRNISEDAYRVACALSELKNKFLLEPLTDHLREERASQRPSAPPPPRAQPQACAGEPAAGPEPKRENARDLVREALTADRDRPAAKRARMAELPWARIAQGAALASILLLGAWVLLQRDVDLDRMDGKRLATVSPYLELGKRNGAGSGPSFVGEIADDWLALPHEERERIAEEIVDRLRAQGMQQVMIYDDDRRVRIQALGSQPIRVL